MLLEPRLDSLRWSYDFTDLLPDAGLPCVRMVHFNGSLVYVELRYFHSYLKTHARFKRRRNDWVRSHLSTLEAGGIQAHHCARASSADGAVNFDTCSVSGFTTILCNLLKGGNAGSSRVKRVAADALRRISYCCCQMMTSPEHRHRPPHVITVRHRALEFALSVDRRAGRVANWFDIMAVVPDAIELWQLCCRDESYCGFILVSDIHMPLFNELVAFVACGVHRLKKKFGSGHAVMVSVLNALVPHIAFTFQASNVTAAATTTSDPRPPVIRHASRASLVDPHVARNLLDRARSLVTVPAEVLRFNNDRPEYAQLTHTVADLWFAKELCMYRRSTQDAFQGICQFSVAADPSVYNGEDSLVSLVYSAIVRKAAALCVKVIPRCKHVALDDLMMTDRFAAVAIARKQQRWAAFKEIRAISSQISDLTRGYYNIFWPFDGNHWNCCDRARSPVRGGAS